MTSLQAADIINGELTGDPELQFSGVVTDSRQLASGEGLAFIAIKGKNHDGHLFIRALYEKGTRVFILEQMPLDPENFPGAAFIITENSVSALQKIAAEKRREFKSTVIAITGSTGKTIVKEWLADVLGLVFPVVRSPKSYNSQIGVPLSVLQLDPRFRVGIFEAGISMPGEMENLRRVIKPDIGVLTNIGDAHRENFSGNEEKAREKLLLFKDTSAIIYCFDDKLVSGILEDNEELSKKRLIGWSLIDKNAPVFVRIKQEGTGRSKLDLTWQNETFSFRVPFSDRASIENTITVTTVCLYLNIASKIISKGLESLVSVAMRMEIKAGINGSQLIEDYYNSDPGSLNMAIDFLKSQGNRKTTLIISDFVQSGKDPHELYGEVAEKIRRTGIDRVIGIGPGISICKDLFNKDSKFFDSTSDFISNFNPLDFSDETILIKGARKFEFESIGRLLQKQAHQTLLEVNLDAIAHNLNEFRRHLNPGTGIMAMVKAFAYGAGPAEIAGLLEYHRVNYLGVAYPDEGLELRNAGVTLPIMVMNPDPFSFEILIRHNLEPEIYSLSSLRKFIDVASRHGIIGYPVHLKLDTGMHRLGFMNEDMGELLEKIRVSESIRIASVFSHLAASENPELDNFTVRQADEFKKNSNAIKEITGYSFLRHICNSAAILRFPQYQFEMVRPGIGIYGAEEFAGVNLRPVGRFKTRISQIKSVPAGDPVGYGCTDISERIREIAILPVGYADGLSRKMGNGRGFLFIGDRRAPVVGNVCMDMVMADVSGMNVQEGDEAEIFGNNIKIQEVAQWCETIPYEILTSIPSRVKRVFLRE